MDRIFAFALEHPVLSHHNRVARRSIVQGLYTDKAVRRIEIRCFGGHYLRFDVCVYAHAISILQQGVQQHWRVSWGQRFLAAYHIRMAFGFQCPLQEIQLIDSPNRKSFSHEPQQHILRVKQSRIFMSERKLE